MSITTHYQNAHQANTIPVGDSADDFFKMDQRKNEFMATLAHELRNPLAPIKNGLQLLSLMGLSREAEDLRVMMARQADQIVRLVDDLLDISRISCGKVVLHKEPLSLGTVVEAAVEESIGLIIENGLTLEVFDESQSAIVFGDAGRLTQVICNLLNNSAKYGKPGGKIELSLNVVRSSINICVSDDGIGISPNRLKDIFAMYSQIDNTQSRGAAGLGIGLALVRTLVELHGGQVEADSDGPGRGSTFTVSLPLAPESLRERLADVAPLDSAGRPLRVLVVDDLHAMRLVSSKLLEKLGHEVRAVENGQAALDMLDWFKPDVVLSDITMPVMDGYELARRIREQSRLDDICLVALTGYGQSSDREKTLQSGFDRHMTKPVDIQRLQELFAQLSRNQAQVLAEG